MSSLDTAREARKILNGANDTFSDEISALKGIGLAILTLAEVLWEKLK